MVTDINQSYCGNYVEIYTNIKSLFCTPKTNVTCQLCLHLKILNDYCFNNKTAVIKHQCTDIIRLKTQVYTFVDPFLADAII